MNQHKSMTKITTFVTRGKNIESVHIVKALVINKKKEILLSTKNDNDIIFPRSSIKIFQAIPFANSNAKFKYNLNTKQIALACSSHTGEKFHIRELVKWIKLINIPVSKLKCGVHNPLNLKYSNKILLSGTKPNQLHNNCSGKHLAMLTTCLANHYTLNNYLDFKHPHQINIRKTLEFFCETKIRKINYGLDGCSAPQYALRLLDLSTGLLNLVNSYNLKFKYSPEIRILLKNILNNPHMIGGTNKFDSYLINKSNKKIFCKGGAEGVFLFAHLTKQIVGIVKIKDGNERALPSAVSALLKKLNITSFEENKKLSKWSNTSITNHSKQITGKIFTEIK